MNILNLISQMLFMILHLTDIDSFPRPLTKEEEDEAIEQMINGDDRAKKLLIEHNLRLVAHVVKKYYTKTDDRDDLISVGTIGLIKGINSYKPNKGVKLATYCARCIDNEILMLFRKTKKTSQEISFSDPIDTDSEGNPLTLTEIIAVDDTIVDDIDTGNKLIRLSYLIAKMPPSRDKDILTKRYGLNGEKPLTQRDVAKEMNISRSYVSRIEKRILGELRNKL